MALVMEDDVPPEAPRVVSALTGGAVHSSMFVIVT